MVVSDKGAMGYVNGETIVDPSVRESKAGKQYIESFKRSVEIIQDSVWCGGGVPLKVH